MHAPSTPPETDARDRAAIEWPTLALLASVYGGWAAITFFHADLPLLLVIAAGAWLVAWQSSLQHEILHGHPTRWRRINRWLALPALSLWLPYDSYRISHLVHHRDERLTDPLDDPESFYWTAERWRALGPFGRGLFRLQHTLAGRLLFGPLWNVGCFLIAEARKIAAGDPMTRRIWAGHLLHAAPIVVWLALVCRMSLAFYFFAIVYPATSLMLIRSFAEHRARDGIFERTAIVENSWILGPLFLFNNLHAAHHANPTLPWNRLPAWYRAHRDELVRANGGLVYDGYRDVFRRFLFRAHDRPEHPTDRASGGER